MLRVDSNKLYTGLSFLRDIIPTNPHIQTFSFVHISEDKNGLLLRGMDIGKHGSIAVELEETDNSFSPLLVPMTKFYQFMGEAKKISESVKLSSGDALNILLDDNTTAKISTMDAKEFPNDIVLTKHKTVKSFSFESDELLNAIAVARFCSGQFLITQSIHLFVEDGVLYSEATSGYSGGKLVIKDNMGVTFDLSLMADFERIVSKSVKLFTGTWDVFLSGKHFTLFNEEKNCLIGYAIVNEKYKPLHVMYRNSGVSTFKLDKEIFVTNLNIIKTLAESNLLTFAVNNGELIVKSDEMSADSRDYKVAVGGGDCKFKLDIKELELVLAQLTGESIYFQVGGLEPILVFDDDTTKKFFIVLQQ